ncbi:MAG: dTDP-4-dehydrorhamnose 3,5-epimerase family protein [Ilumatobacter sp.]|nr:dTDP-4-dehydrorhamnose 3,5-epimerase family protein [Ilumatobacter sp.]
MIEFSVERTAIEGLLVSTMKQVGDDRGIVREMFRRSAFEQAGIELAPFAQVNLTESRRGALRGLHAEAITKLTAVAWGEAVGGYADLRPDSPTFGAVERVELRPGMQVLVPAGVANGFQALVDGTQYVYCFDREWRPGMEGRACSPIDAGIAWPIEIDPDDTARLSHKDRAAPPLAELLAGSMDEASS